MTTRPLKQPALWPLKVFTVLSWALVLFLAAETIVTATARTCVKSPGWCEAMARNN